MNQNKLLLIIDAQVGVLQNTWNRSTVVENISKLVNKARSEKTPIIWVQHTDEELVKDSAAWKLVPELLPNKNEPVISKQFNSAFEETELQASLETFGATHIVCAGAATNWCIRATAYGAIERGYNLTLVQDAHTTEDIILEGGHTILAKDIVTELNIIMNWIAYPNRTVKVVPTEDIEFS